MPVGCHHPIERQVEAIANSLILIDASMALRHSHYGTELDDEDRQILELIAATGRRLVELERNPYRLIGSSDVPKAVDSLVSLIYMHPPLHQVSAQRMIAAGEIAQRAQATKISSEELERAMGVCHELSDAISMTRPRGCFG